MGFIIKRWLLLLSDTTTMKDIISKKLSILWFIKTVGPLIKIISGSCHIHNEVQSYYWDFAGRIGVPGIHYINHKWAKNTEMYHKDLRTGHLVQTGY